MGRKLKKVALNFQWEIGKIWSGFVNPHNPHECKECAGLGLSKEYNNLQDKWYSGNNPQWKPNPFREGSRYDSVAWNNNLEQQDVDALIEADRLWDFTRVPINEEQREIVNKKISDGENSWLPFDNGYKPSAKEVNEWNLKTMGHDSLNCYYVIKARLVKEGKSHLCSNCKYNFLVNLKTGRILKQVMKGGSIGYVIKGKFYSLNKLRQSLVKILKEDCPF